MTPEVVAGWSALVAAVASVFGAAALVLFFARGKPWGTIDMSGTRCRRSAGSCSSSGRPHSSRPSAFAS